MTGQLRVARCLVCGAVGDDESALDGLLRRCATCTFAWTTEESASAEELYGREYFLGEGYDDYYQPKARRFESRLRLRWLLSTGAVASLVEAGAAGGYFVAEARAAGIDAIGIEISEAAVTFAREQLGVPVQHGAFEAASFPEPVEAVCAFHVLEHAADPVAFLHAAHDALVPGGRLALEVPNIASAAAGRLGSSWPHVQPRYHRWHFTPGSLNRLVRDAGFHVVQQDTVFSRFYWQPRARLRHARELLIADVVASRSLRVTHPTLGDALRLIVRRPGAGAR
jgi:SAM-dependent methyltransferase